MHKCLDEFDFRPVPTTHCIIICPLVSGKSTKTLVATLVPSFLLNLFYSCNEDGDNHKASNEIEYRPDPFTDC